MRLRWLAMLGVVAVLSGGTADAQKERQTPYWASIASGKALMRTGPAKTFPGIWLYQRADLPIQVLEIYPSWRKIRDPDGAVGWMQVNLLSDTRTALVRGDEPRPLHAEPTEGAAIRFRAAPGVVGRLSDCGGAWCRFEAQGRAGYIRKDHVWGVDPGESF